MTEPSLLLDDLDSLLRTLRHRDYERLGQMLIAREFPRLHAVFAAWSREHLPDNAWGWGTALAETLESLILRQTDELARSLSEQLRATTGNQISTSIRRQRRELTQWKILALHDLEGADRRDIIRVLEQDPLLGVDLDVGSLRSVDNYYKRARQALGQLILTREAQDRGKVGYVDKFAHHLTKLRSGKHIPRPSELARYERQLREFSWIVIEGMPGTGKTTLVAQLAARLAGEQNRTVFWYTFMPDMQNTLQDVLWEGAKFLAYHGDKALWETLRGEVERGRSESTSQQEKIRRLAHGLERSRHFGYLLCFDDVHWIDGNVTLEVFFKELRECLAHTPLILIGRHRPAFALDLPAEKLGGFELVETEMLLGQEEIHLPPPLLTQLHERVRGNPQLLRLFASLARTRAQQEWEILVENLAQHADVRDYLLRNHFERLALNEREVLVLFALALLAEPCDSAAISFLANIDGVDTVLLEMVRKNLIDQAADSTYSIHPTVQEFSVVLMNSARYQERARTLRIRAGEYFADRQDFLRAIHHYLEAKAYDRAVETITTSVAELVVRAPPDHLLDLFGKVQQAPVSTLQQAEIQVAVGWVYRYLGHHDRAIQTYQAVFQLLDGVDMDTQDPATQLKYRKLRALTHSRLGSSYADRGLYDLALIQLQESLHLYEKLGDHEDIARVASNMGAVYYWRGIYHEAIPYYQRSLQAYETQGDSTDSGLRQMATVSNNLGAVYAELGKYKEATQCYERSLRLRHQIGDISGKADSLMCLANIALYQGRYDEALKGHRQALEMKTRLNQPWGVAIAHNNMAEVYLRMGQSLPAIEYAQLAIEEARLQGAEWIPAVTYRLLAEAELSQVDQGEATLEQALQHARTAHDIAERLNMQVELGTACCVLGKIYDRMAQNDQAHVYFREAVRILKKTQNALEIARALRAYGLFLLGQEDQTAAQDYLQRSLEIFERLGAEPEAREAEKYLTQLS